MIFLLLFASFLRSITQFLFSFVRRFFVPIRFCAALIRHVIPAHIKSSSCMCRNVYIVTTIRRLLYTHTHRYTYEWIYAQIEKFIAKNLGSRRMARCARCPRCFDGVRVFADGVCALCAVTDPCDARG